MIANGKAKKSLSIGQSCSTFNCTVDVQYDNNLNKYNLFFCLNTIPTLIIKITQYDSEVNEPIRKIDLSKIIYW